MSDACCVIAVCPGARERDAFDVVVLVVAVANKRPDRGEGDAESVCLFSECSVPGHITHSITCHSLLALCVFSRFRLLHRVA